MRGGIICGVEDTEGARSVVRVARALAAGLGEPLLLVHVASASAPVPAGPGPFAVYPGMAESEAKRRAAEGLLSRLAEDVGAQSFAEVRVVFGSASELLPDLARDERAELLVVGAPEGSRLVTALVGSTFHAVMARADCAVVVVPSPSEPSAGLLLCAVGDSPESAAAVALARRFDARLGRGLILLHVLPLDPPPGPSWPRERADGERARAHELLARIAAYHGVGAGTELRVERGRTAETIVRVADETDAALIVMGNRRRGHVRAALGSSVSRDVIARAGRPVLLAPRR